MTSTLIVVFMTGGAIGIGAGVDGSGMTGIVDGFVAGAVEGLATGAVEVL